MMVKKSKPEWLKDELLHMQRWEEEGGKTVASAHSTNEGRFVKPMLTPSGTQNTSTHWNEKFVIEPFRSEAGDDLTKTDAPNKI